MSDNKYNCVKCGACCTYWHNIPISIEEMPHIDENLKKYIKISYLGVSMKLVDNIDTLQRPKNAGRCIALEGEVGKDIKCSIYEIRPPVCRRFEAGSDLCKKVRLEVLGIVE